MYRKLALIAVILALLAAPAPADAGRLSRGDAEANAIRFAWMIGEAEGECSTDLRRRSRTEFGGWISCEWSEHDLEARMHFDYTYSFDIRVRLRRGVIEALDTYTGRWHWMLGRPEPALKLVYRP
jgi:hypothetical protein